MVSKTTGSVFLYGLWATFLVSKTPGSVFLYGLWATFFVSKDHWIFVPCGLYKFFQLIWISNLRKENPYIKKNAKATTIIRL